MTSVTGKRVAAAVGAMILAAAMPGVAQAAPTQAQATDGAASADPAAQSPAQSAPTADPAPQPAPAADPASNGAPVQLASADPQPTPPQLRPVSLLSASSPSNGTADVSPSTVAQNMERLDEDSRPLSLSLGAIYASGDFGTASTTSIVSSALGARYRAGNWRLTASLPWMSIRSRSTIFTGIDGIPVLVAPDTSPVKRTADGFGDLTLGAAYTVAPAGSSAEIEFTGRAKINTAGDGSRLSSGENDYAAGVELTRPVGRFAPFASITYRFLGDTATYRLRDGVAASAGSSVQLGEHLFALASYHYAQSATRLVDDLHELFFGLSAPLGRSPLRATGFVATGLSDGAAGISTGIALSLRL